MFGCPNRALSNSGMPMALAEGMIRRRKKAKMIMNDEMKFSGWVEIDVRCV
jgi:hypothetical protein